VPFFNEEKHLTQVAARIREVLESIGETFELILVDDGSRDGTWNKLQRLAGDRQDIYAIRLSRNFGKEAALAAGLEQAKGDAVITLDGDLQHPPALIEEMVRLWRTGQADVVEAKKTFHHRDTAINRIGARVFYDLQKRLTGSDLQGASDFKLLDRKVVDAWKHIGERNLFFRGICQWLGFRQVSIPFTVEERVGGRSKWTLNRLLDLAVTGIVSFSSLPLQLTTLLGLIFFVFSGLLGLQTLYMKLAGNAVSGFTTVILLVLITGSLVLLSLGIIGAYLAQIYEEVKGRPRYLVSESAGDGSVAARGEDHDARQTITQTA
jgi:glycosyltransferase involved in cell wall biosynthesis